MSDTLGEQYPQLANALPKLSIADLPTPLEQHSLRFANSEKIVLVKRDDATSILYGGNKVRKLEYLLQRALQRNAKRVATFGTVASNHALATAIHAAQFGLECTCFLSHQARTAKAPLVLNMHLRNRSEIVRFGGNRQARIQTLRQHLRGRSASVIPMGGSSWRGVLGFVNAGLEVAAQLAANRQSVPDFLYVANGSMGTTAGLALGLALAGLATEIQAVRVTHEFVANEKAMRRLIGKTANLMRRFDASIPADLAARTKLCFRDEFFGDGYARTNAATDRAIATAREQLGLVLDETYSGKAMAALLHDISDPQLADRTVLFWNTYHAEPLPVTDDRPADTRALPEEFLRYYD